MAKAVAAYTNRGYQDDEGNTTYAQYAWRDDDIAFVRRKYIGTQSFTKWSEIGENILMPPSFAIGSELSRKIRLPDGPQHKAAKEKRELNKLIGKQAMDVGQNKKGGRL